MIQPPEIDKRNLYGEFQKWIDAKQKLGLAATYKALDMPQDDMNIVAPKTSTQTTNVSGMGTRGVIGTVLAATLGTGILGAAILLRGQSEPEKVSGPAPAVKPTFSYEFDEIEEIQLPDGTWKPTGKKTRKRVNPDGTVQTRQSDGSWK